MTKAKYDTQKVSKKQSCPYMNQTRILYPFCLVFVISKLEIAITFIRWSVMITNHKFRNHNI